MSKSELKDKPSQVDSKVFQFREQKGACRDLTILHRHSGRMLEVERADIPELIEGLRAAYYEV